MRSNSEIADRLESLAQLLSVKKQNFYRVKAYRRAAAKIRNLPESIEQLVRDEADLMEYSGIGSGIAHAIREIVATGTLRKLDDLRSQTNQELTEISLHPRLDPQKVLRAYKRLKISSIEALKERLDNGEVEQQLGPRMAQHIRQGLMQTQTMLLYKAEDLHLAIETFLLEKCHVSQVEVVGEFRRRVEVIETLDFLIETDDFPSVVAKLQGYGGHTPLLSCTDHDAVFGLSSGIFLGIHASSAANWGRAMIITTGSKAHLGKLANFTGDLEALNSAAPRSTEAEIYRTAKLQFIEPELREGHDELQLARRGKLPVLISLQDLRGELHAHSLSSDGVASIEDMSKAARAHGYDYIGMSDHSQSLKIAHGVTEEDLWKQIRFIDRLNEKMKGILILKSSEVDILADGALDYPDDLLKELDYTVCSIHSRFGLAKPAQTERILRAMDNRYFNILGHATGRLLLKRPGYEIDMERIIQHARQNGCFFEINSSPDRLDLSADNAREAARAGVKIAITTDAHSTREFGMAKYGVDQGRRAALDVDSVLNCLPWEKLRPLFAR